MNPAIKDKFNYMGELIKTGHSESKELRNAKYRIKSDHLYQSIDDYLNLKRSINNIVYEVNSIFSRIVQLSFEEPLSARIYIKMLLWYYKMKVRPLVWLQEMNT